MSIEAMIRGLPSYRISISVSNLVNESGHKLETKSFAAKWVIKNNNTKQFWTK